ncbi:MAG: serine/threonine-protein kinase, partial [Prochlorothrix sp.]
MAWSVGQKVNQGKYKILRILGEGGFGITYLAEVCQDDRQGDRIVIKTLRDVIQQRDDFDELQQDFINEAVKMAKCSHPHVVAVMGDGLFLETVPHPQKPRQPLKLQCLPLEYIDGEDLAVYLLKQPQRRLSEREALTYIQQVGAALMVVHSQGLLHRDIKPNNILLRQVGSEGQGREAVLIDFGIARDFRQDVTQTHTEFYTAGFAPPEQYDRRAKRGAYTDIYALAATLYCMVTGQVPPEGRDRELSVLKHRQDLLEPPSRYVSGLSASVCDAILWGLRLNPQDRPQTMEEWLRLLGQPGPVANPVPVATQPSPPPARPVTPNTVPAPRPAPPQPPRPSPKPHRQRPVVIPKPPVQSSPLAGLLNRRTFIGLGVLSFGAV